MSDDVTIHPQALCDRGSLGPGSRVEAFATVAAGARAGARCVIGEHATLGPGVVLGDGVEVGAGARLMRDVRVGPGAVIGANAVVASVEVGRGAVVTPGATVTVGVPPNAIVEGNPALITGYVTDDPVDVPRPAPRRPEHRGRIEPTAVPGVAIHPLQRASDLRGSLMAAEFDGLPFVPRRVFTVLEVPSEAVRGSHAHRECQQFLVCLSGTVRCLVDDGTSRDEVQLVGPDVGLHMPAMIWGTQYKYSRDAVLLVLASHPYDADDYIRSYDEFLELVSASQTSTTSAG